VCGFKSWRQSLYYKQQNKTGSKLIPLNRKYFLKIFFTSKGINQRVTLFTDYG
jgi:hypothetical protein